MQQRFITVVLGVPFNDKNEVLLSQRHAPEMPSVHHKWQLIGGGVEFGETPEEALAREFLEETQLRIEILIPHPIVKTSIWTREQLGTEYAVHATLLAYITKVSPETPDWSHDPETADVRWWKIPTLSEEITLPHTLEIIREATAALDLEARHLALPGTH